MLESVQEQGTVRQPGSVVVDRGEPQLVPEQGAVLAVVAQEDLAVAPLPEGGAHLQQGRLVSVGPLQETAIAADNLPGGVTGHEFEAAVDVDEGRAGPFVIAYGYAVAAGRDCPVQEPR